MSHLTLAASERAFIRIFEKIRDGIHPSTSGSKDLGPFRVSWSLGFRLEGGRVDFEADGSGGRIKVNELDIVYDPLRLGFGLDLPSVCVGGWCIIPKPWGGCFLRAPRYCVFDNDPDVSFDLDLSDIIESEISAGFRVVPKHERNPNRSQSMTDLDAEDAGFPDKWNFYLDPIWIDFDLIDIADTVGNILDRIIDAIVNAIFGWLPDWAQDLIEAILGSISDLIRAILDIGDDIDEWLSNLLGVSLGIFDLIIQLVAEHFAKKSPIFGFEDPLPVLPYEGQLIPVKIPVRGVNVTVFDTELVAVASVGT